MADKMFLLMHFEILDQQLIPNHHVSCRWVYPVVVEQLPSTTLILGPVYISVDSNSAIRFIVLYQPVATAPAILQTKELMFFAFQLSLQVGKLGGGCLHLLQLRIGLSKRGKIACNMTCHAFFESSQRRKNQINEMHRFVSALEIHGVGIARRNKHEYSIYNFPVFLHPSTVHDP